MDPFNHEFFTNGSNQQSHSMEFMGRGSNANGTRRNEQTSAGQDPFSQMDAMMNQMIGGNGMRMNMGGMNMGGMHMGGMGGMHMGGMGGMSQMMSQMQNGNNNGQQQQFSSSSFSSSSSTNGGQTKQYRSSSTTKNVNGRRVSETKHSYSDSNGVDKKAWERTLDGQGRKIVQDRHGNKTEHFQGMEANQATDFEHAWNSAATQNNRLGGRMNDSRNSSISSRSSRSSRSNSNSRRSSGSERPRLESGRSAQQQQQQQQPTNSRQNSRQNHFQDLEPID